MNIEMFSGLRPDVIVPNPTFMTDGSLGHTELVVKAAEKEDIYTNWEFWPTGPRKTATTPPHGTSYAEKEAKADSLIPLLELDPELDVYGLGVLVYDDVCTTGLQLDRVARFLMERGASSVEGIVMARTPWD